MEIKPDIPIYLQIAMDIKEQIISHKYLDGDKLPSVRELSVRYEVSALTVQRAMQQLEQEKIIQSKKGIGSFVTENCREALEEEMIYKQAKEFVNRMKSRGLGKKEIEAIIKEVLNDVG